MKNAFVIAELVAGGPLYAILLNISGFKLVSLIIQLLHEIMRPRAAIT